MSGVHFVLLSHITLHLHWSTFFEDQRDNFYLLTRLALFHFLHFGKTLEISDRLLSVVLCLRLPNSVQFPFLVHILPLRIHISLLLIFYCHQFHIHFFIYIYNTFLNYHIAFQSLSFTTIFKSYYA